MQYTRLIDYIHPTSINRILKSTMALKLRLMVVRLYPWIFVNITFLIKPLTFILNVSWRWRYMSALHGAATLQKILRSEKIFIYLLIYRYNRKLFRIVQDAVGNGASHRKYYICACLAQGFQTNSGANQLIESVRLQYG